MTLSAEKSPVLRGADLDALPVAMMVTSDHAFVGKEPMEISEEADEGPAVEELLSQAYQAGFDEGVAAAEAAIRSSVERTLGALELSARDLSNAKSAWEKVGPGQTVDIALEIAEMVMMREVVTAKNPGRDAIVRCLAEVTASETAVLRLNPADLEALGPFEDLLIDRTFELAADPSITSGDAVADTTTGSVDARLRGALGRVREELLR